MQSVGYVEVVRVVEEYRIARQRDGAPLQSYHGVDRTEQHIEIGLLQHPSPRLIIDAYVSEVECRRRYVSAEVEREAGFEIQRQRHVEAPRRVVELHFWESSRQRCVGQQ